MKSNLFIRNLSWSIIEEELADLFGQVGQVLKVKIPVRREDGKPRGFAFVEMGGPDDAKAVIDRFHGYMLDGRELNVDYQDEERMNNRAAGPQIEKNPKLFVRNLAPSVSEDSLAHFFQQIGQVLSVKIPMDRDTGMSRGFGFVEMSSTEEAEQVIQQLNNQELEGYELSIIFQDPNRSRSNANQGGGGGYNRSSYHQQNNYEPSYSGGGGRW